MKVLQLVAAAVRKVISAIVHAKSSALVLIIFVAAILMSVIANWGLVQDHWKVVVVTALFAGYLPALTSWFILEMIEEDKQKIAARKAKAEKK